MKIKTRFAPSPTGLLHIGNARTALINYLYAKHFEGSFILRIDDTDLQRSTKEYEDKIVQDLRWLGLEWEEIFWQSKRLDKYEGVKNRLILSSRLYECYETPEELNIKRKLQLSSGKPPIYDRASLKLSQEQKVKYRSEGRRPHYRFKLEGEKIEWNDLIKGALHFDVSNISDPIVIREDGSMTYMICSTVDDIEFGITNVIRGEDHVTNTAIQIQMFESLGIKPPIFGHLGLVKAKDDKISKRIGGFEISSLKNERFLEPMSINSFFATIGSSKPVLPYKNLENLAEVFDISSFSTSSTTYVPEDLERINQKLLHILSFEDMKKRFDEIEANYIDANFWDSVRPNLKTINDARIWWNICHNYSKIQISIEDIDFLIIAKELLPNIEFDNSTWKEWTEDIKAKTGRVGRALFMPIRLALTGMEYGPELSELLPLIGRNEVIYRLNLSTKK